MENKIAVKTVVLKEDENKKDILEFNICSEEKELAIKINDEDQSGLRNLFYKIIQEALREPFELKLEIEEGYNKVLFVEISTEYIKQLNIELKSIVESYHNLNIE